MQTAADWQVMTAAMPEVHRQADFNQPVMKRQAMLCNLRSGHFHLHARHVHANGAFPLAGFTGHAQLHRVLHCLTCQRIWSKLTRHGKAQRIGTSPHSITFIAGGTVGRAHHPAGKLAACAVIVTHLNRALETTASTRPVRPVQNRVHLLDPIARRKPKQ